jgi:hypothetical protein
MLFALALLVIVGVVYASVENIDTIEEVQAVADVDAVEATPNAGL